MACDFCYQRVFFNFFELLFVSSTSSVNTVYSSFHALFTLSGPSVGISGVIADLQNGFLYLTSFLTAGNEVFVCKTNNDFTLKFKSVSLR